jgi:hypothetical protein
MGTSPFDSLASDAGRNERPFATTLIIRRRQAERKCRLASDSIAERYTRRRAHLFHSDKVLADRSYSTLSSSRSERTDGRLPDLPNPQGQILRRLEMKQLLIVLSLLVASAAPAAALEFNFDTIHVFGR